MLACGEKLEVVTLLENSAVVGGDVEKERHDVLLTLLAKLRVHGHLEGAAQHGTGDMVLDDLRQVGLVDHSENVVSSIDAVRDEAPVQNDEYLILRVADDCCLVLRHLNDRETFKLDDLRKQHEQLTRRKLVQLTVSEMPLVPHQLLAHQLRRGKPG